jgi:hypothetical protein
LNKVLEKKYRGKKYEKKSKAEQGLFRSRDFVSSGEKGPTRADIACAIVRSSGSSANNLTQVKLTTKNLTILNFGVI